MVKIITIIKTTPLMVLAFFVIYATFNIIITTILANLGYQATTNIGSVSHFEFTLLSTVVSIVYLIIKK